MRKTVIAIFSLSLIALICCKSTDDSKITIETIRRFGSVTPIEVNVFVSNAAFTHIELISLFDVERGHYPLVYRIQTRRNDQQLVEGFYVTRNQEEASVLSRKADKPKEFVLFLPEKEIRITPGNDIKYIIGKITEKH